ncbi:hypothetical protein A2U01_0067860, partial [Trifolium medium]|nr:hypothetical protein [Trifolium medium]
KKGDNDKRPTKVTASARRKNAAKNPPKKRARKGTSAPETAHPVHEHHEGEPAHNVPEHHEGEPAQADDIVREMEDDEL